MQGRLPLLYRTAIYSQAWGFTEPPLTCPPRAVHPWDVPTLFPYHTVMCMCVFGWNLWWIDFEEAIWFTHYHQQGHVAVYSPWPQMERWFNYSCAHLQLITGFLRRHSWHPVVSFANSEAACHIFNSSSSPSTFSLLFTPPTLRGSLTPALRTGTWGGN